ncbi:hypothetical protein ACJX0J_036555, partial [Zea mays]
DIVFMNYYGTIKDILEFDFAGGKSESYGDTSYRQNEVEADVEEIYQEIEPDSVAGDLNDAIVPPKRKRKYSESEKLRVLLHFK